MAVGDNRACSDKCPYTSLFRLSSLTLGLYMCSMYSSLIFYILLIFISVVKLSEISNIASKMYQQPYAIGVQTNIYKTVAIYCMADVIATVADGIGTTGWVLLWQMLMPSGRWNNH